MFVRKVTVQDPHRPAHALAGIPLFSTLDEKGLARVAQHAVESTPAARTVLYARGDACDGVYAVMAGRVKLALPTSDGGEKVIALIGPGESFGESAVFLGEPHLLSAQTLVAATLVHVSKDAVLDCMRRDPRFAASVAALLSRRLNGLVRDIEDSATRSGTQRVIDFLAGELPEGLVDGAATIALPAKKRIIASRLDLTHEHFSRILHDLVSGGLLVVQAHRVVIPDVRRFRGCCSPASHR